MAMARWSAPLPEGQEQKEEEKKAKEIVTTTTAESGNGQETQAVAPQVDGTAAYETAAQDEYKASTPKPEQSVYTMNRDMLKSLTPPLTDEERARRQRAASSVEMIGHLGNAANAIANLIGVKHGARPQSLPNVDLTTKQDTWRKEMDAQRKAHAAALAQARNADYNQYRQALADWYTGYKIAADTDAKAYEAERNAEKDAVDKAYKLGGLNVRGGYLDVARTRAEAAMIRAKKYQGGRSGGSGKTAYIWLGDGNGGRKQYRQKEMMDRNVVTSLYNELMREHPEYNASPGREYVVGKGFIDKTPKVDEMRYAVWDAVENGDFTIPEVYEVGKAASDDGSSKDAPDEDNTPPSRRKGNDDNTPPSRRKK